MTEPIKNALTVAIDRLEGKCGQVELNLDGHGYGTVRLGGHDISKLVRGLTIEIKPGSATKLTLHTWSE